MDKLDRLRTFVTGYEFEESRNEIAAKYNVTGSSLAAMLDEVLEDYYVDKKFKEINN